MEGATGTLGATAAGAVCATGAACSVSVADERTAGLAGGFVQPSCSTQFAIICLVCREHLFGCVAVRLPSQGGCNTNTNSKHVAGEPSRAPLVRLVSYC